MGDKTKRCLSFLLTFVLAASLCPATGVADDGLEMEPELGSGSGFVAESTLGVQGEKLTVESAEGSAVLTTDNVPVTEDVTREVAYVDADGTSKTTPSDVPVRMLSSTSSTIDWGEGAAWYVVSGVVELDERVTVSGDVRLILSDGAKLTAGMGIEVTEDNSLTIYGQVAGTGELVAAGEFNAAGIGGHYDEVADVQAAGGKVTVNGGEVTATGGIGAAGIGGGYQGAGGKVTVNGGKVTATGAGSMDAGADGEAAMGIGAGVGGGNDGTLTLGKGVQMETSEDNEEWADATSTPDARTRYMRMHPHVHDWAYFASGAIISATCNNGGCPVEGEPTLTLEAPALETEGGEGSAEATLAPSAAWTEENGLVPASEVEVLYYSGETLLDKAPTAAGSYRAETGEIPDVMPSAKVSYTIAKKAEPEPAEIKLSGSGHVQDTGDAAADASGEGVVIGTTGESRRLEAFSVSLPEGTDGSISYRAHLQNTSWVGWEADGKECGTTGASRRIEAVQMKMSGAVAASHNVWYRVHSQDYGWLGWAKDGQAAGTAGQSLRAEAVEVQVLPRDQTPKSYVAKQASYIGAATVNVHLKDTGWTGERSAIEFGTTGESRRMEAISISVPNQPVTGKVEYQVHAKHIGWTDLAIDGGVAGTTGESRRIEALRVTLRGDLAAKGGYTVWYRVHTMTYGWLGWAKEGEDAGTTGLSTRAEAVDVEILPQGQVPNDYDASKPACING